MSMLRVLPALRGRASCLRGRARRAGLWGRLAAALAILAASAQPASAADADPRRGAEQYRLCAACHALEPGVHTTGPSLAGMFDRPAGTADGFARYSPVLRNAGFPWDEGTLDAWLTEPAEMLPGTYMDIPGMPDAQARTDLIAFLRLATAPGGVERVVADGLISAAWVRGVAPQPVGDAPPEVRVTAMRHCGDSFFITTADGAETPYWEKNVRMKIDSTETGPPAGVPVLIESGRMGDRTYVIFRSVADLQGFIAQKC